MQKENQSNDSTTRRRYLATTAAIAGAGITGCVGFSNSPVYEEEWEDSMVIGLSEFPRGWVRNDEINENFDSVFTGPEQRVVVLVSVEVFESVSSAESVYSTTKSGASATHDYGIGDEAFWTTRNDLYAYTVFRDSNAVAEVHGARISGVDMIPDQTRSQTYARKMYENWETM